MQPNSASNEVLSKASREWVWYSSLPVDCALLMSDWISFGISSLP